MARNAHKLERFSSFLIRRRYLVMLVFFICWGIFSLGAGRIQTDVILRDLFPYDHPYLKLHARFSEVFGGGGFGAVIAVNAKNGDIFNQRTLSKVKEMTDEIILWDEVYRFLTVSMATNTTKVVKSLAKGELATAPLMFPNVPETDEEMELLKQNLYSNPAYAGILASDDGTAALILTTFKEDISYERAFTVLRDLHDRYSDGDTSIHVVGYPMLMGWIYSYKTQMYWVFGISVALMALILYVAFRNLVGMIAPVAMAVICTGLGLGFIGWTGINFSPLLYVLAFLVGARMLSNSVQITNRYIHEYREYIDKGEGDRPRREAAQKTLQAMLMPNAAAVATDTVGFMVLSLAKIVLMQQLAILMSFWMLTIALSGILVPLICSVLPRIRAVESSEEGVIDTAEERRTIMDRITMGMTGFSIGGGKYIIGIGAVAILILGGWQTLRLKVGDPTPGSPILWPDHPYNVDQALINSKFKASSENFMLFYEGETESVYDPIVTKTFEAFDRHMATRLPDIYKSSSSINDLLKTLQLTFRDGDQFWYQVPPQEKLVRGLFGLLQKNMDPTTRLRFVDAPMERAQITLYFSDHTSDNMLRIREAAYDFFKDHSMKIEKGDFKLAGGAIGLEIAVNEEMQRAHAIMDFMVLVAIFIMCTIAFRSFVAGAMLAVPLLLSNLIAFAYMAMTDIGLSVNTLPCSAVGVGVGVDFAIYFYSRCVEEFPRYTKFTDTVLQASRTAGKGIIFTGITLILPILTWYFISALKFQAQMGFFLSMLLFTNMVAALTLHPLLIMVIKPRFMQRRALDEKYPRIPVTEASVEQ